MILDTPLRGDRLLLRSLGIEDANADYLRWMQDPEVQRYLESRFSEHSLHSLRQFIESMNDSAENLLLGICLNSGRHIGNIKLGPIEAHHLHGSIGLLIGERDTWGQGYAGEAIGLLTRHAFASLKLRKLFAGCYSVNPGSQKAFIGCGFKVEGRQEARWLCEGEAVDNILMGMTREQWLARAEH